MRELPSWITKYIGIPFLDKGRGPEGWDCWGIVKLIYEKELGIILPDYLSGYSTITDAAGVSASVTTGLAEEWRKLEGPAPMALLIFNIYGRPLHVGMVVSGEYFLHAPESDLTRLERFTDRMWEKRVEGFYEHIPSHS